MIVFMKKRVFVILLLFLPVCLFVFYEYIFWEEGKNRVQNAKAHDIHVIMKHYLESTETDNLSDIVLSSNKNIEINNTLFNNTKQELKMISEQYNMDLPKGDFYIEIRNGVIYKVLFARWKFSGFTGESPDGNAIRKIYNSEVKNSLTDFNLYLNNQ